MCGYKEKTPLWLHVILSVLILFATAAIAYFFPKIISMLGVIGGMTCVNIIITFPGLLFLYNLLNHF